MSTAAVMTQKSPIEKISLEKRLGRSCRAGHGSQSLKKTIARVSLEDRLERIRSTEPEFYPYPEELDEHASLEDRLLCIRRDNPDRYRKSIIDKVPLSIRLEPASKGCFMDPYALIDMLKRSVGQLLEEVLSIEDNRDLHLEWNVPLSDCEWASYQDAACMIRDAWRSRLDEGEDMDFCVDFLSDDEYSVFLAIVKAATHEVVRRENEEPGTGASGTKSAPRFPAYTMPLPQLFQAAAECCPDEERKEYFSTLYDRKFRDLFEKNEAVKDFAESRWRHQPVRDSSYCDTASAAQTIIYAAQTKNIISLDEEMSMLYDILIAAFIGDREPEPLGSDESYLSDELLNDGWTGGEWCEDDFGEERRDEIIRRMSERDSKNHSD